MYVFSGETNFWAFSAETVELRCKIISSLKKKKKKKAELGLNRVSSALF